MSGKFSQRRRERRQQKLDDIAAKVADGTLVIRKMTAAERKQHPARPTDRSRP